ncbi:response regulator transcription factor [Parachryseolinea silvisoli]|uniref:response regulator transcription factor n=1 Tax=Parachryseolinea silvisoli TaxID=2873601 RepID=UPI002265A97D|nr:response regulator transcription factor [Parachryseolinea silvisoli]MCD9018207.1 response regulator transcription factor [Parachryseolinea silvisoli]
MERIKILLVDDHTVVRDSIAIMLAQFNDIQIVGSLSSGEELISKMRDLNPDMIIMDIHMKGMSGIEATRWVKERNSKIKVVLLSMEVKKELVSAGIQSGIDGYLPKEVEKSTLIQAIRAISKGEKYFNEAITNLVFEDFYNKEVSERQTKQHLQLKELSKREMEVLQLVASGKSDREVAEQLFISTKTVNTHKMHILDKLGLKNTAELVRYAIKNELITF